MFERWSTFLATLIGLFVLVGATTTTASAAAFGYDVVVVAGAGVHESNERAISQAQFNEERRASFSRPAGAQRTSTTPDPVCVAPNTVAGRQGALLDADVGYNISPESFFSDFPALGRSGTFVTDARGIADAFGSQVAGSQRFSVGLTTNLSKGRVGYFRSRGIERSLGLDRGGLRNGFRLTEVPGISSMAPRSPLQGNQYFLGPGRGLPNGAPELVVDSVRTSPWPL